MSLSIFFFKLVNSKIRIHTDNKAVVDCLNKLSSKCKLLMQIIRPLTLILLKNNIQIRAIHIPGKQNTVCDILSRQEVHVLHGLLQPANRRMDGHHLRRLNLSPTPIPTELLPHNFQLELSN